MQKPLLPLGEGVGDEGARHFLKCSVRGETGTLTPAPLPQAGEGFQAGTLPLLVAPARRHLLARLFHR